MWQQTVQPYVKSGDVVVLGIVQEQHPDRARLYRQWRQLKWPILVDALNLLDLSAVPVPIAIDGSGIVRHNRMRPRQFVDEYVEKEFPVVRTSKRFNRAPDPDLERLASRAEKSKTARAWRKLGDAHFLSAEPEHLSQAVEAYQQAIKLDKKDARAHFRLGVALRRRYESSDRSSGDGQAAVEQWGAALALNPNQYIWRRRIQQYGPRLDKPYNFYFWVEQARREIRARGETPLPLAAEPMGSEIAAPMRRNASGSEVAISNLDPEGRIKRDTAKLVAIEPVVTPARVQPGHRVRVRTTFRLDEQTRPLWNNEAAGLSVWVGLPDGLKLEEGRLAHPDPKEPETREMRVLEFEVVVDADRPAGTVELPAYALYYVCEEEGGVCLYLRQDFKLAIHVDPDAPKIQ